MSALESLVMTVTPTETRQLGDVRAASAGDRLAYGRLVDGTRNLVCSISLGIVRDVATSEDVAQEVYLAAWQGLGRLRNAASFLPWLRQLTRNRAHDHVRRRTRVPSDAEATDTLADPRPDAGAQLVAREEEAALTEALAQLPESAREVVTLFYREGRSTLQVAELLGLSEAAVKKRLQRAREDLREATMERLGESLRQTAPAAAFTTLVLALVTGAPATAAAANLTVATTASTVAGKLLAGMFGSALGPLLGVTGVVAGVWLVMRRARDEEERRQLRHFGAINTLLLLLFAACLPPSARIFHGYGMLLWLAVSVSIYAHNYRVWLPRITARREALERAEDPRAAVRQRRHRLVGWVALMMGALTSGATIIWVCQAMSHAK